MIKKLIIITVVLLTAVSFKIGAQDPHFSQFYANPIYLNPAFAGSVVCPRLTMNYRNQWPSISGAYVTYNASYDMHWDNIGGGFALMAMTDRSGEGALTQTHFSAVYAPRIKLSQSRNRSTFMKFGGQVTYYQHAINPNKLTFGDQIDPRSGFVYNTEEMFDIESVSLADFSAGLVIYTENFYWGVASHHLTEPNQSFLGSVSPLYRKYTSHIGGNIRLKKNRRKRPDDPYLSPNAVFMMQNQFHQMNYGLYFKQEPLIVGLYYRQFFEGSDAVIFLAGLQYDKYLFAYSYDITVSKLGAGSGGAHEFTMKLMFNCPYKRRKLGEINCPSF
jgi:type IX secretion system PorP/SprF family membrane protein